jgi:hypothetical protein
MSKRAMLVSALAVLGVYALLGALIYVILTLA